MAKRGGRLLYAGTALAVLLVLAGCTKGGQFDPTELLNNDMFDTKKKLKGERIPVFPNGVPGATTGVPPDLVKGYQPPPDQPDPDSINPPPAAPPAEKAAEVKPKPKPKVAVKRAAPTRISVGRASSAAPQQPEAAAPAQAPQQSSNSNFAWPAPLSTAAGQQPAQPAQQSQSIWPNPPAQTAR